MLIDKATAPDDRRDALLAVIAGKGFPCVGAKSAMAQGALRTVDCYSIQSEQDDARIHAELLNWVETFRKEPGGLRSLAVLFSAPKKLSERQFEKALWERLQSLAVEDSRRGQHYDTSVSSDPNDASFSLSFGGAAFFVIGMHPAASRPARRTQHPTLVFNLHAQFERLRENGRYERMRETIIRRDIALAGSANPMLARFGETSEARQYSGRVVDADWRCPFRDPRTA